MMLLPSFDLIQISMELILKVNSQLHVHHFTIKLLIYVMYSLFLYCSFPHFLSSLSYFLIQQKSLKAAESALGHFPAPVHE